MYWANVAPMNCASRDAGLSALKIHSSFAPRRSHLRRSPESSAQQTTPETRMYSYATHSAFTRTCTRARTKECVRAHPASIRPSISSIQRETRLAKCELLPHFSPPLLRSLDAADTVNASLSEKSTAFLTRYITYRSQFSQTRFVLTKQIEVIPVAVWQHCVRVARYALSFTIA